jgi:hypothetical protein
MESGFVSACKFPSRGNFPVKFPFKGDSESRKSEVLVLLPTLNAILQRGNG